MHHCLKLIYSPQFIDSNGLIQGMMRPQQLARTLRKVLEWHICWGEGWMEFFHPSWCWSNHTGTLLCVIEHLRLPQALGSVSATETGGAAAVLSARQLLPWQEKLRFPWDHWEGAGSWVATTSTPCGMALQDRKQLSALHLTLLVCISITIQQRFLCRLIHSPMPDCTCIPCWNKHGGQELASSHAAHPQWCSKERFSVASSNSSDPLSNRSESTDAKNHLYFEKDI